MCGLIGVSGTSDAAREVFLGLMNLQHRGQDGAGILSLVDPDSGLFGLQKGSGLVENVFSERSFKSLGGVVAIGHTRYATVGRKDPNLLQPFLESEKGLSIAHNGNIVNYYALKTEMCAARSLPAIRSDSELILHLIASHIEGRAATQPALFDAIERSMRQLVGSYAIVGVDGQGGLFGFRDPDGIRPLVFGRRSNGNGGACYALASETVALSYLGYQDTEEVAPGEAIYISAAGDIVRKTLCARSYSPCMFEWVYFARVESVVESLPVYEARFKLGLVLAERLKELGVVVDVVIPVPETSRAAAIAIAESMDLPFRESLIKNRYVNRTFILDTHEARQEAIKRKLYPIASEIKGKRCLVVDDSIVRGTTGAQIIDLMRQSGAAEVILVSTCPQIKHPCYYGIDFPSESELAAANCSDEEVARKLGADRVIFQTLDGLKSALSAPSLCTGCLTGDYPTDISAGQAFAVQRVQDRSVPNAPRVN